MSVKKKNQEIFLSPHEQFENIDINVEMAIPENIDIDKDILENINIDIDINMGISENI